MVSEKRSFFSLQIGQGQTEQKSCIFLPTPQLKAKPFTVQWAVWKQPSIMRSTLRQSRMTASWNIRYKIIRIFISCLRPSE